MATVSALEVRIKQGARHPDVGRFTATLTNLTKALHEIDRAALVERVERPHWVVSDLDHKDRLFTVRLTASESRTRDYESLMMPVTALVDGAHVLRQRDELPDYYSESTINRLVAVAIPRDGIERVSLAPVNGTTGPFAELDESLVRHARAAVRQAEKSIGSITGTMDVIKKVRNGVRATVYDPVRHRAVTCSAPSDMEDSLREAWAHRVTVRGHIVRNPLGQPLRIAVRTLELLPEDDSRRSPATALRGALPSLTGGRTVDEFLREVRGG